MGKSVGFNTSLVLKKITELLKDGEQIFYKAENFGFQMFSR
jgi:hypothetical protein